MHGKEKVLFTHEVLLREEIKEDVYKVYDTYHWTTEEDISNGVELLGFNPRTNYHVKKDDDGNVSISLDSFFRILKDANGSSRIVSAHPIARMVVKALRDRSKDLCVRVEAKGESRMVEDIFRTPDKSHSVKELMERVDIFLVECWCNLKFSLLASRKD